MRILAADIGTRRIGFAVSTVVGIAVPFGTAELKHPDHAVKAIEDALHSAEAEKLLVGLPLNMDGTAGEMADKCMDIGRRVSESTGIPVEYWDERLSTVAAEKALIQSDMSRMKRRKVIDKMAARVFLQAFLDSHENDII